MWCSACQQDVPGISHVASGRLVCSRCQQPMRNRKNTHTAGISDGGIELDEPAVARVCTAPPKFDDWQTRQRTRHLGRELRRSMSGSSIPLERFPQNQRRFDPPAELFDNSTSSFSSVSTRSTPAAKRTQGGQVIAWFVVMAGFVALCGGLGGIAWSIAERRDEFWNESLGLTLAGQGILIFGLVLVVSRLWRNSRYATGKLQDVHTRLGELQRTAEALSANRGGAPAFYADMARGAPPQILLSNLKGQVEQLAARLGG